MFWFFGRASSKTVDDNIWWSKDFSPSPCTMKIDFPLLLQYLSAHHSISRQPLDEFPSKFLQMPTLSRGWIPLTLCHVATPQVCGLAEDSWNLSPFHAPKIPLNQSEREKSVFCPCYDQKLWCYLLILKDYEKKKKGGEPPTIRTERGADRPLRFAPTDSEVL